MYSFPRAGCGQWIPDFFFFFFQLVTDEACQSESIREVLKVEGMMEGGCRELLDKEQALVKQGV